MKNGAIWRLEALTDSHLGFRLTKVYATVGGQRQHFVRFHFNCRAILAAAGPLAPGEIFQPQGMGNYLRQRSAEIVCICFQVVGKELRP